MFILDFGRVVQKWQLTWKFSVPSSKFRQKQAFRIESIEQIMQQTAP